MFTADVADLEQMRKVVAQTEERFGRINGVIHTAGVADFAGVIQRRSREMTEDILASKVKGTLVLDRVLKHAEPDFFLLCSSVSNILYKIKFGQVGYSAANEFLDAFACYKTMRDGILTISVNWEDWQEIGISVKAAKRWAETMNLSESRLKDFLRDGLLPAEGAEVFHRVLESGKPRIAVCTRDLNFLREQDDMSAMTLLEAARRPADHTADRPHKTLCKNPDIGDWFYLPGWKQSPPPRLLRQRDLTDDQKLCWLVFADRCGLGIQLADQLEKKGGNVVTVTTGSEFTQSDPNTFTVNPGKLGDYDALFRELRDADRIPKIIAHLWSVTGTPEDSDSMLGQHLDSGFYSLLFLVQVIEKQNIKETLRIIAVSDHLQRVTGDEPLCPGKAALLGPVKVIPQEYPDIRCRSVDLLLPEPGSQMYRKLADWLLAESTATSSDTVVAYRGNHRWVQTFEPIRLDESIQAPRLRKHGVYWITGGFGRIGLTLAECLAKNVKARLILTGRSTLPPRTEWDDYLAKHDQRDDAAQKIRKVKELEELGAEVVVASADVADEKGMQEVMAQAEARFGSVNGILCAAGFTGEKAYHGINETDKTDCMRHFHPKLSGILTLEKVLQGRSPDFCLLISSLSSVLGGLGAAAYAAANFFVDAYAHQQQMTDGEPWTSLNWERWKSGDETEKEGVALGSVLSELAISPEEGSEVFQRIMSVWPAPQIIVSSGDLETRIEQWVRGVPKTDVSEHGRHTRPNLQTAYAAPENEIQRAIVDMWQDLLGIDQVGIHDNFFDLGGHSLLGVQLISRVRDAFQMELSLESIFESPTIADIAKFVDADRQSGDDDFGEIADMLEYHKQCPPLLR